MMHTALRFGVDAKVAAAGAAADASPLRLPGSAPRPVRLTGAGRAATTVAVLLFVAGAAASLAMQNVISRQTEEAAVINTQGTIVTGEVTRLWKDGDNRRQVGYRFSVEGRSMNGRARVSDARRRELTIGTALPVRYVPGQPQINDLGGTRRASFPVFLPYVVGFGLASLGAIILLSIGRERRLLEDGRATIGHVTARTKRSSSHGGTDWSMTYEFALLSGATAAGKSGASRKGPTIGSALVIIYDPEEPTRNKPYPFGLVRPVAD